MRSSALLLAALASHHALAQQTVSGDIKKFQKNEILIETRDKGIITLRLDKNSKIISKSGEIVTPRLPKISFGGRKRSSNSITAEVDLKTTPPLIKRLNVSDELAGALKGEQHKNNDLRKLVGMDLSNERLTLLSGESFTIGQKKGQTILIEFWTNYCPACTQAAPNMRLIAREFPQVLVLGANCFAHGEKSVTEAVAKKYGFQTAYLCDKLAEKLGIDAVPMFMVIDKNGRIVGTHMGFVPGKTEAELSKMINSTLKKSTS